MAIRQCNEIGVLGALPSRDEIVDRLRAMIAEDVERKNARLRERGVTEAAAYRVETHRGFTAQRIAWALGVKGAQRAGRGAIAGSWSGTMAPALRIAPRLGSMVRAGVLSSVREGFYTYYAPAEW